MSTFVAWCLICLFWRPDAFRVSTREVFPLNLNTCTYGVRVVLVLFCELQTNSLYQTKRTKQNWVFLRGSDVTFIIFYFSLISIFLLSLKKKGECSVTSKRFVVCHRTVIALKGFKSTLYAQFLGLKKPHSKCRQDVQHPSTRANVQGLFFQVGTNDYF